MLVYNNPERQFPSKRDLIIQVAHKLFLSQGYHGTSMRQIATHAGIALGGIYNHFPSKEEIFHAVLVENHPYKEILPDLADIEGEGAEFLVSEAARRLVAGLERHPDLLNLMFIEIVEFDGVHFKGIFSTILPEALKVLQHVLQTDARVRPIPLPILVRTFMGFFFSYYMTDKLLAGTAPPAFYKDAMGYFVNVYLHGILSTDRNQDNASG